MRTEFFYELKKSAFYEGGAVGEGMGEGMGELYVIGSFFKRNKSGKFCEMEALISRSF